MKNKTMLNKFYVFMFPAATVDETMKENVNVAAAVGGLVVFIILFSLGLLWCKHSEYVLLLPFALLSGYSARAVTSSVCA